MTEILVTGALGNVGSEIVKCLQAEGNAIRAADINVTAMRERFSADVEVVPFDFTSPDTYPAALDGIKCMFLMRPPHISNVQRDMFPFLDAAYTAGVEQVVFLSLIGIEQNQQVPHYKVEQYLKASTMTFTFLRASFFMQNLSGMHQVEIRDHNEIFLPVGYGKTSFIDVRDIGAVGAKTLTESGHEDKAYDLTGLEALDYYEVAKILSEVLERDITYRDPSILAFIFKSLQRGTKLGMTLVMSYLYTQTKRGMSDTVKDDVEKVLGRKPISLKKFIQDNQGVWKV
jgi:uncharacterized protein YbjT (DUF2867 family)